MKKTYYTIQTEVVTLAVDNAIMLYSGATLDTGGQPMEEQEGEDFSL